MKSFKSIAVIAIVCVSSMGLASRVCAVPVGGRNDSSALTTTSELDDSNGNTVPDGGSTIAFLGLALAGAELFRRSVSRRATVKA